MVDRGPTDGPGNRKPYPCAGRPSGMEGTLDGDVVRVAGDARQRFHDARGYGRPVGGNEIELAPVEAAHLLSRDDLDAVVADDGRRLDFRGLLARSGAPLAFVVYKDLRDRGFYLSPAREAWLGPDAAAAVEGTDADFVVYPRGSGPGDGEVAHRVRVLGERDRVAVADLGGATLAVVDEDGDLTYFETGTPTLAGDAAYDPPADLDATLFPDRVLLWDPPEAVYERGFYGQRLGGRNAEGGPLQLSLIEAAHLARRGVLTLDGAADDDAATDDVTTVDDPEAAVVGRGRAVEDRFDRRLRVYEALRAAGTVPKSGFKFGADFRVYESFTSVSELDHSDSLVRVVDPDHAALPRDLSLDVRLAGGVRKRMVFALPDANGGIDWLSVARLTP